MTRLRNLIPAVAAVAVAVTGLITAPPVTAAVTSSPVVKPVVSGLMDRKALPVASHTGAVRAFVVDVRWADLQPTRTTLTTAPIDTKLAYAKEKGLRVKMRVRAGADSPAWVKSAAGTVPVATTDTADRGRALAVPRWWTPTFRSAFDALHAKLAAKYDAHPSIGQVTLCGPSVHYCEPFLRSLIDQGNRSALLRAGFTVAADKAAHTANMDAGRHWRRTRVEIAFNPYQALAADGSVRNDVSFTIAAMREFRAKHGSRAVLANNSVRSGYADGDSGPYGLMYAEQKRLGKPLSYQTATVKKIGDWRMTLRWAAQQGASSVELPSGYVNWPVPDLKTLGTTMAVNGR